MEASYTEFISSWHIEAASSQILRPNLAFVFLLLFLLKAYLYTASEWRWLAMISNLFGM